MNENENAKNEEMKVEEEKSNKLAKVGNFVKANWKKTVATVTGLTGALVLGYIVGKNNGDEDDDDYSFTDVDASNSDESTEE